MFGNILIWFVIVPILMMAGLGVCRNSSMNAIRTVMVTGSVVLLGLAIWLCCDFLRLRGMGVDDEMLFTGSWMWYAPLNIHLAVGVDGISVLMLLLSAVIVFAGTFASWKISPLPKNFFLWFALLPVCSASSSPSISSRCSCSMRWRSSRCISSSVCGVQVARNTQR